MSDRRTRIKPIVWMTALIALGCVLAVAMVLVLAMYVWAHLVPPLEAEPTPEGLLVQVNRPMIRDVAITVDSGVPVTHAEMLRGAIVLPWSDFGLVASPTLHDDVREVHATGMSRFSRFETTISFIPESTTGTVRHNGIAQTLNYVTTAE